MPNTAAEIRTAGKKEYLRAKEFCRRPRKANSSQIPARASDTTTATNPKGEELTPRRRAFDSSTAWLDPKIVVSIAAENMFNNNKGTVQPNPIITYFGLRLSLM